MNMTLYVVISFFREPGAINGERPELIRAETSLDPAGDLMLKTHKRLRTRNRKTYLRTEVWRFRAGVKLAFAEMPKSGSVCATKVDARTFNRMRDPKPGEGSFELV